MKEHTHNRDSHCAEGVCNHAAYDKQAGPAPVAGGTKFYLDGLSCASCAAKIEDTLNRMEGVRATLNFAASTLYIDAANRNLERDALKLVRKIEPGLKIKEINGTDEEEDEESTSPILVKIFFAGIFFVLGLVLQNYLFPGAAALPAGDFRFWAVLLTYLTGYIIAGHDVVLNAVRGIMKKDFFGENMLMTIATLGAFAIKEFPEAVGVMLFFKVGEYLEDRALNHSRSSIRSLLKIRPDYANLKKDGETLRVNPEEVQVNELIMIRPGEKVPLDGVIEEGQTSVDTSALTGESMPKSLNPGDNILSGMINRRAVITVRVTKPFGESTVNKILDLVEKASEQKAPTEKFITKFSRIYTPAVVAGAFAMAILPPVLFQIPALTNLFSHPETYSEWIYRALIFLVIACPCALVISIPVGFFGGIGAASKKGILFKGSNYLEAFRNIHTMVFDKTGTLTEGEFKVSEVKPLNGFTKAELLRFAAEAESHSTHPIARSIMDAYGEKTDEDRIKSYEEISSHGIRAIIDGKEILAGNDRILHMDGYDIEHDTCRVEGTVVHIVIDKRYAGYIILADRLRPEARETIDALRMVGVKRIMMLTGDSRDAAEPIARELGLDAFHAELLPQDKIKLVRDLEDEIDGNRHKIGFVGDGINDAPVLTASDIGIAMGGLGSDAAIEAADVVLMKDRLSGLLDAMHISRRTSRIVFGNITMALGIKGFFIIFGALGMATMWEAVFADVGVAILAVLNSTRVLKG
ncbi:MAG TPA: cadmium-translocating P-type ATPase [Nitrospirae bacterium]|nr:cadmium-translocating P-type ATPase [Nitrospirota bacterium]HDY70779.1 cadmium-translocating P-type ATPase [Nitrospirota bacterium]